MATRRGVVEGDTDAVGVVAWQHLLGAPVLGPAFCLENHYPRGTGALAGLFRTPLHALLRWIWGKRDMDMAKRHWILLRALLTLLAWSACGDTGVESSTPIEPTPSAAIGQAPVRAIPAPTQIPVQPRPSRPSTPPGPSTTAASVAAPIPYEGAYT